MMRPPHDFDSVVMELYQGLSNGTIVLEKPSLDEAKRMLESFLKFRELPTSVVEQIAVLTSRQREVLRLLAEGRTSAEVSKVLGIGAKDLEADRASILRKLRAGWIWSGSQES